MFATLDVRDGVGVGDELLVGDFDGLGVLLGLCEGDFDGVGLLDGDLDGETDWLTEWVTLGLGEGLGALEVWLALGAAADVASWLGRSQPTTPTPTRTRTTAVIPARAIRPSDGIEGGEPPR